MQFNRTDSTQKAEVEFADGSRSYRGALDYWDTAPRTGPNKVRRPISMPIWRALWSLVDFALWIIAASLTLSVIRLFNGGSSFEFIGVFILPIVVSLVASWVSGGYDRDSDFVSLRFASEFLIAGAIAAFVGAAAVALFSTYGQGTTTSRAFLFGSPMLASLLWLAARRYYWKLASPAYTDQRLVVIGSPEEATRVENALQLTERKHLVVQLSPEQATNGALVELLTEASDTPETSPNSPHDTIVMGPSASHALPQLSEFLVSLHSSTVPVYTWSAFWSQRIKTLDWGTDSPEWFFEQNFRLSQNSAYPHIKRLFDILVAGIGILVTLPIYLLTALLIRLDSPGAAIFKQARVGLRAKEFTIYKFRTMTQGAEKSRQTTSKNDSRITRLGNFLRKFRIDEIPQLWNVLKGDMSIVGPRPEWIHCVSNYEDKLPHYHLRHLVKPGITGWAQVNYPYGEGVEDARNKLSFDLYYVAHSSLLLDCSILLKTIYVLAGRVGGQ
jgi:exopolysaccharide biosynthesis polyprenyl glycosylphosphotransferase